MKGAVESFAASLGANAREPQLRRAAMLLHTVAPADRAWLLGQLPALQRQALEALLEELSALGMPAAPALLDEIVPPAPVRVPAPKADAGTPEARLEAADPTLLARVLADEPIGLVVRLVTLRPWRMTGPLLARLEPQRREQVMERLALLRRPHSEFGALSHFDAKLLQLVVDRVARLGEADVAAHAGPSHDERRAQPDPLRGAKAWWQALVVRTPLRAKVMRP
jgi:hypothetical protein